MLSADRAGELAVIGPTTSTSFAARYDYAGSVLNRMLTAEQQAWESGVWSNPEHAAPASLFESEAAAIRASWSQATSLSIYGRDGTLRASVVPGSPALSIHA